MNPSAGGLTLSVLDQSPIRQGGAAAEALRETVELAEAAERFGYRRFWVAEHHSTGSFAGAAPEILIGQIAAHTKKIQVGSGGVMLSHYSALKVAEVFRQLATFYPGRIGLGIGRAPGSDQRTAQALAYPRPVAPIDEFPGQVVDLLGFLAGELPTDHPFHGISAQPGRPEGIPDVWLLGSSDYSARLAAALGLPFSFADFFGVYGDAGPQVAALYRRQFRPSESLDQPKLNVAVHVVCAESAERAHYLASSRRVMVAMMRSGHPLRGIVPPDEATAWEAEHPALVARFARHDIVGDPTHVREQLEAVAGRYETDDLTIAGNLYDFEDRLRSFELTARAAANGATQSSATISPGGDDGMGSPAR